MKQTYTALEPLNVNGKPVELGDPVDLTDDEAKQPLGLNAIKLGYEAPAATPAAPETPAAPAAPVVPEGQERIDAIKTAIGTLNVDVAENWAKDGKPKTDVIAKVTGWPVSAAERDTIWTELHPAPAA